MNKVTSVIIYTAVIIILVGALVFYKAATQAPPTMRTNTTTMNATVQNSTISSVSQSELSTHNKQADCWISYKGKVYDITEWLPNHPGSAEAIAPYCGNSTVFENAFTEQHGTSQAERLTQEGTYKGELK